ncbi:MAG: PLP-dependent aminotransferase family protein [Pseudomonadota bacterium]
MFSERVARLDSSLIREILAITQRPEVISFAGGLPAADVMPPLDLAGCPAELRQYGPSEGEPWLRQAIAEYVTAEGRPCTADQVLVLSGSQQGIDFVSKLFVDPGTPVALEAPTYLAAVQSFRLFGARFVELPVAAGGVDPERLRAALLSDRPAFAYLIPTFQNPSGCCYDLATRRAVARLADEFRLPVVEDEPYRELVYDQAERTPITSLLERAPWVYLGTFSKTGIPGLRIAYAVASKEIFPQLLRLKQAADLHTNRIGQWAAHRLLTAPDREQRLERLRAFYRARRDAMQAALAADFAGLAEWRLPSGGLFFWLRLRRSVDTQELLRRALKKNVAFMPGEPFYANPVAAAGAFRLNFSHAAPERIAQGVTLLKEVAGEVLDGTQRKVVA